MIWFDSLSLQLSAALLPEPTVFRPERWLPDAVEQRKGTPAERLDHTFFAAPFSQGARKCPGSRVANLEVQVALLQLVGDWIIELEDADLRLEHIEYHAGTTVVPTCPRSS